MERNEEAYEQGKTVITLLVDELNIEVRLAAVGTLALLQRWTKTGVGVVSIRCDAVVVPHFVYEICSSTLPASCSPHTARYSPQQHYANTTGPYINLVHRPPLRHTMPLFMITSDTDRLYKPHAPTPLYIFIASF